MTLSPQPPLVAQPSLDARAGVGPAGSARAAGPSPGPSPGLTPGLTPPAVAAAPASSLGIGRHRPDPIAILGAACRLPGAPDLDAFWNLLISGRDAVTSVPPDRFTQAAFLHPRRGEAGRTHSFAAGTIGDVAGFDAGAFGISPREAAEMDPQQRLLLEVTARALEDAGIPPSRLAGTGTGVYVGASLTDYADLRLGDPASGDRYFMTGGALSILANRIGNVFDLRGPAQTIDTACSSALVALHLACEALRAGRLPTAVVGGVNLLLSPFPFLGFARAGMLSATGRCQAFSAGADGYVRAEGAGVVVLKRLADAVRDGDPVRAVILGTGSNAAGRTLGISLPSQAAQTALIRQVLAESGVAADRLAYFEAHGTGTAVGDPVEATAIGHAIGQQRRGAALPIGSAKGNIGHTEPASGLVGLLKAMLVLEKGRIPPSLHCATPNPAIDFPGLGLRVATAAEPLTRRARAVVGVNSFGFGGTNATAMLAAAPPQAQRTTQPTLGQPAPGQPPLREALPPLLLSARSAPGLAALAATWQDRLAITAPHALPALLRGAARHRDLHAHRLALRGSSPESLAADLAAWVLGEASAAVTGTAPHQGAAACFVFSGNGAQWAGMAQQALVNPAFRAALAEADAELAPLLGWSVLAALEAGVTAEQLADTDRAQPLLFAIQHAMVAALAEQGIRPALVLGHSVGEVAAALAAGLLSLPAAARLIVARSRQQQRQRGIGRMAALGAGEAEAAPLLAELGLEIAAVNAPAALTVAGPAAAIAALVPAAEARRWSCIPLDLDYAFHSAAMDPVRDALLAELAGLPTQAARLPMLSSVTGQPLAPADCTPDYWWDNLRQPVRFQAAVLAATRRGTRLFIEIGPHPVLQSYLRETLREASIEAAALPGLSRRDPVGDPFPALADRAFAAGADPRGGAGFAGPAERRALPATPFIRQPAWFAITPEAARFTNPQQDHPLLGFRRGTAPERWTRVLDTAMEPWLADHRLAGEAVLPAAAMLEMALAACAARHPEAEALEVSDFAIHRALPLAAETSCEILVEADAEGGFRLSSRPRLLAPDWLLHATGRLAPLPRLPQAVASAPGAAARRLGGAELVAMATAAGLGYGPAFQPVQEVALDPAAGLVHARLVLPASAPDDAGFLLHPVRLDGALQGLIGLLGEFPAEPGTGLVPVRFERLALRRGGLAETAELRLTARGERSAAADLVLRDAKGEPVAVVGGIWLTRIRLPGHGPASEAAFRTELVPAIPHPLAGPAAEPPALELAPVLAAARGRDASLDLTELALLLEGFCAASAHAALAAHPAAGPYARALLERLAEDGLAAPSAAGLRPTPAPDLPTAREIWRQVLLEQPCLAPELAWIAAAAERLPGLLAGDRPAEAAPHAGAAAIPAPGALPPSTAAGFDRLCQVLAEAVAALVAAWPEGRPLRVLEVGAGLGPLTARLVTALSAGAMGRPLRVVYVAASLPGQAMPRPPGGAEGVEFDTTTWDPLGDAAAPLAADLIIGLACGAQLRAGTPLAAALRQAAAPGAVLLLAEPLPGPVWEFCAGQDPAWWQHAAPLPAAEAWAAALGADGWGQAAVQRLSAAPWPAVLLAGRAPAGAALLTAPVPRRVMLVADAASAASLRPALAAALAARGANVTTAELLEAADLPPRTLQGTLLVLLASGAEPALTLAALSRLAAAAEGITAGTRLVTLGGAQPVTLGGAQPVTLGGAQPASLGSAQPTPPGGTQPGMVDTARHSPAAAACFALGRVLANEHPGLRLRRIDCDPTLPPDQAARRLAAELLAEGDAEAEVTLTATARLVPRLRPGLPPARLPAGPLKLVVGQPGHLGTLRWAPQTLPTPGAGEVALRIEAAGLNFRDLMWAQGLLPEETLLGGFAGPGLGMECAGVVEAVGPGVRFRPGDRVFGVAPQALATHAVTRAEALALLPPGLDAAAAATIPVAFLTAVYALEELARLEPGERVLIHGGAGAVGLAALQVALARGARVAGTAGTAAKRAFLRAAGAELALDSRDPGFADVLRAEWGPGEAGCVDVLLNSLAGEAMERSLGLLRPFGRFLELGKRDFAEDRRVALRPLRHNATFFAVDVDELPRARPQLAARLLAGIRDRIEAGSFRPLPHADHSAANVEAAFRTLQASAQIGKLVLRPPVARAETTLRPALQLAARGTVLVLGGTQGFGLATARWLAGQGVHHLALVSRRGAATPGAAEAVADLAALGARATLHACDATDAEALATTLASIRATMPALRGVVQAAAVFADGAAARLDPNRVAQVLAAKLTAAENLDRLTARDPLALFLLYSSATVAVGNPGQAAYVAANAALEALARRRRAAGRPALAIQWGPISDAGVLAADGATAEALSRRLGARPMLAATALAALPELLASGATTLGLARLDWTEAQLMLPLLAEPMFDSVRGQLAEPAADLRARLLAAPDDEALPLLRETLAAELARILRLAPGAVAADAPLAGLGLDSLGGMELRAALDQRLGLAASLGNVTETLTVDALAQRLLAELRRQRQDGGAEALMALHEPALDSTSVAAE